MDSAAPSPAAGAILAALLLAGPALAQVQDKDEQKCTAAMDGALRKVSSVLAKEICGCIVAGAKGRLAGTIESCVAGGNRPKVLAAEDKTSAAFAKRCAGALPPFGVLDAAAVNAAARAKDLGLARDVFGPDLDQAVIAQAADKAAAKCQARIAKDLKKCQDAKLAAFAACAKQGLKDKSAPFDAAADLEACLGLDPQGKIAKKCDLREEPRPGKLRLDAIRKSLAKACDAPGVSLATAFPGCANDDLEEAHACLDGAVECRTCLAVNAGLGLARDCDLFDDGLANFSCPALLVGAHTCVVDPDASGLVLETPDFILTRALEGAVDVDCGVVEPATGNAACTCTIDHLEPVEVFQTGWACISPAPGCAPGLTDCDGGEGLDVEIASLHNVGPCTGNADCATQCAGICAADGATVFESGCEGFCEGGSADDDACLADVLCPAGICTGPDGGFHGNVCQCHCLRIGGNPSAAGGLRCNLGARIAVEQNLPCGDGDVLIDTGTHCIPFTTEFTEVTITDVNNQLGVGFGPDGGGAQGVALACPALAADGAAGLGMLAMASFLDAPLVGDATFIFFFDCQ